MDAKKLKEEQDKINDKIIKIYEERKENFDNGYILDGIADIEGYADSNPRIAWILKEAWDEPNGGEWDLSKEIINTLTKDKVSKTPSFKRVAYVARGIETDTKWDELPWITEDESVVNALKKVAWLNISKIAGKSVSPNERITSAFETWEDILKEQLEKFDPQIIILGNTYQWVRDLLQINREPEIKENSAWAYIRPDNKIIVWAFHPSKIMKDQEYIDDILNVIKEAKKKNLNT